MCSRILRNERIFFSKYGLTTAYNVLNRSGKVTITTATGRYIDYTYDATGTLLKKQQYDNSTLQKTTDYIDGGFVAENSTLIYFAMPEGKVMNTGGTLKTQYLVADQQGNVRVSVEDNGNNIAVIKQENSYYPFGLIMPNSQVALPSQPNKNLYNAGSEWQNDYGDLPDLYQTFYRSYDAALGRFTGIDPMAESAESLSPYQYAGNNPVMFNDPLGNDFQRDEHGNLIPQAASRYTDGPGDEKFQKWENNTIANMEDPAYLQNQYNNYITETNNKALKGSTPVTAFQVDTWYKDANGQAITVNGNSATTEVFFLKGEQRNADESSKIDWGGVLNAGIGVIGGIAETALGAATAEFGIGLYGIADGGTRTIANSVRLAAYLSGHKDFGDAAPSNVGALVGKIIDGNDFYKVGNAQTSLSILNDFITFGLTGTNLQANPAGTAAALAGLGSDAYTFINYYYQGVSTNHK